MMSFLMGFCTKSDLYAKNLSFSIYPGVMDFAPPFFVRLRMNSFFPPPNKFEGWSCLCQNLRF